jgi:hypothetical protein
MNKKNISKQNKVCVKEGLIGGNAVNCLMIFFLKQHNSLKLVFDISCP